ncbi:DUF3515 family protein [Streptomyces sp. NPDC004100]
MNFFRHRLLGLLAPALLIAVAGCSPAPGGGPVEAPRPDARTAPLCRKLHEVLPGTVDGKRRSDPGPRSVYTAGWGGSAIILRCGVVRPPKMIDPKVATGDDPDAIPGGVDGVDWLMEKQGDGVWRFTSANRRAYVELTLRDLASTDDATPALVALAPAVKKAIPEGIASMRS